MAKRRTAEERSKEDDEHRRLVATGIAIASCVIRPCAEHSEILVRVVGADIREAYKYGERMFRAGHLKKFFRSKSELTEYIKSAVIEHQLAKCHMCEPTALH